MEKKRPLEEALDDLKKAQAILLEGDVVKRDRDEITEAFRKRRKQILQGDYPPALLIEEDR